MSDDLLLDWIDRKVTYCEEARKRKCPLPISVVRKVFSKKVRQEECPLPTWIVRSLLTLARQAKRKRGGQSKHPRRRMAKQLAARKQHSAVRKHKDELLAASKADYREAMALVRGMQKNHDLKTRAIQEREKAEEARLAPKQATVRAYRELHEGTRRSDTAILNYVRRKRPRR